METAEFPLFLPWRHSCAYPSGVVEELEMPAHDACKIPTTAINTCWLLQSWTIDLQEGSSEDIIVFV
jgi:hypothetical protein